MSVPEWSQFWLQVSAASGVIALLVVDILLYLAPDAWDTFIEAAKPYLAVLANLIIPQLVTALLARYPTVDTGAWMIVYLLGSYAVHELLYRFVQRRLAPKVARWFKRT